MKYVTGYLRKKKNEGMVSATDVCFLKTGRFLYLGHLRGNLYSALVDCSSPRGEQSVPFLTSISPGSSVSEPPLLGILHRLISKSLSSFTI